MRVFQYLFQRWLRYAGPFSLAALTKLIYVGRNVSIQDSFRCDGIPRILIDDNAELKIGNNVVFRSGVEVRVHRSAKVIIEDNVRIDRGVRILATNHAVVKIGARSRIGLYSVLNGGDSIDVAENCLISGFVYLQTSMHRTTNPNLDIADQGYDHDQITIGNGAWLGAHVVVMPGCTIGARAVVGSNAVVTRSVGDSVIVAGVPARVLA